MATPPFEDSGSVKARPAKMSRTYLLASHPYLGRFFRRGSTLDDDSQLGSEPLLV